MTVRHVDPRTVSVDAEILFPDRHDLRGRQMGLFEEWAAYVTDDGWLVVSDPEKYRVPPGRWHRLASSSPGPERSEREAGPGRNPDEDS